MNVQQITESLKSLRGARKLIPRKGQRVNEADIFWGRFRDVEEALRHLYPLMPYSNDAAKTKFRGCFRWDGLRIVILKPIDPPILTLSEMEVLLDQLIDEAIAVGGRVFVGG